jgi:hypothetical protein
VRRSITILVVTSVALLAARLCSGDAASTTSTTSTTRVLR